MTLVGRSGLLGELKRRYHEADIDGYGRIRMQSLSAKEAEVLSPYTDGGFDGKVFAARKQLLIALCLVDEDGHRLFTDDDAESISEQDAALVDKIYEACEMHVNGERVTAKNLNETGDGDSQSDLQISSDTQVA